MIDIKAATIEGAVRAGKVRVLWRDGLLRAFNADGLVLEIKCEAPVRVRNFIRRWSAETEHGGIIIKEQCWTCGGHLKVAMRGDQELWGSADVPPDGALASPSGIVSRVLKTFGAKADE